MHKEQEIKRSPLFYVGDKYKVMPQLLKVFPERIENFYEPFVGGGTVFLNIKAEKYFLNDINGNLMDIHRFLHSKANANEAIFRRIDKLISKYGLSQSYKGDIVPDALKKEFHKTYYAKFNKQGYNALRAHTNKAKVKDPLSLYILLIYGFNRMLRFNREGCFNLPVGNLDFNRNTAVALNEYFNVVKSKRIDFSSKDFASFMLENKYGKGDFIYIDPPYLIAASEYNKLWGEDLERKLLALLDELSGKKIKFALSNVTCYNGRKNHILIDWVKKYRVHDVRSNYINYHNNKKKEITEILVTNY